MTDTYLERNKLNKSDNGKYLQTYLFFNTLNTGNKNIYPLLTGWILISDILLRGSCDGYTDSVWELSVHDLHFL